jgi:hypothetical protein
MKLVKSLFLGSVAGFAAIAGAQAADLPVAKAAPVEYVRVCSTYGAGFFYIPGTDTCLRVGGRVRAEYQYLEPNDREDDSIGFRARGRIQLDARTATAYGLLRTFVRFDITHNTGVYGGDTSIVDQAFVQFGGLTAGKTVSFFDNGDLPTGHFGTLRFSDAPTVNVLAYTFSFGNGFSATLSLEEGRFAPAFDAVIIGSGVAGVEAGQRAPDLVGNIKYAGTWGTAMLSGAVHQIRSAVLDGTYVPPLYAPGLVGTVPDTEYGWTVSFQGSVNLPMLAAGDALWIAATYADGALAYLGATSNINVGTVSGFIADAFIGVDGDIKTGAGWSVAGGLRHYWTPEIRQNVFGSYASIDYGSNLVALTGANPDFNEWRLGTNLIWSPVSGLDLGVEVLYARVDTDQPQLIDGRLRDNDDRWEGRLRVQRDF